jgi:uncharacterized protein (TIGR03083 family)
MPKPGHTVAMVGVAQLGPPIDVRAEFGQARAALLDLLRDMPDDEWTAATICPGWTARDIVAHLLHDDLRRLSRTRDNYSGGTAPAQREGLVAALNAANWGWVIDTAFLSRPLLRDLLAHTGQLIQTMWAEADLEAPSEGVWWADVGVAPMWFDCARDYSEDWTHQQQIRDAVGRPGLTDARFLDPVLDTFLRALPRTYRRLPASLATSLLVFCLTTVASRPGRSAPTPQAGRCAEAVSQLLPRRSACPPTCYGGLLAAPSAPKPRTGRTAPAPRLGRAMRPRVDRRTASRPLSERGATISLLTQRFVAE